MRLSGKVAIVTGGGSGIGRGIALAMAREGADIAIPDIQIMNAEKVAQEVHSFGRKCVPMRTDVTSPADVKAMVERTREALADSQIQLHELEEKMAFLEKLLDRKEPPKSLPKAPL